MKYTVKTENEGKLYREISKILNIPVSKFFSLARTGMIKLDGKKIKKQDYRNFLSANQIVSVIKELEVSSHTAEQQNKLSKRQAQIPKKILKQIKDSIIFENESIIILNKPSGIATQSGSNLKYSIDDIIRVIKKDSSTKIVHRLDKETCGLLVIAKNKHSAQQISQLFKDKKVKKTYYAILRGNFDSSKLPMSGQIKTYITEIKGAKNKYKNSESEGKLAITHYKIGNINHENKLTEVYFEPITGRTHQLRVHAYDHLHMPILGDRKYNFDEKVKTLALCAYKISIPGFGTFKIKKMPDFFSLA